MKSFRKIASVIMIAGMQTGAFAMVDGKESFLSLPPGTKLVATRKIEFPAKVRFLAFVDGEVWKDKLSDVPNGKTVCAFLKDSPSPWKEEIDPIQELVFGRDSRDTYHLVDGQPFRVVTLEKLHTLFGCCRKIANDEACKTEASIDNVIHALGRKFDLRQPPTPGLSFDFGSADLPDAFASEVSDSAQFDDGLVD